MTNTHRTEAHVWEAIAVYMMSFFLVAMIWHLTSNFGLQLLATVVGSTIMAVTAVVMIPTLSHDSHAE